MTRPLALARLVSLPTRHTIARFRDIVAQPPLKLDPLETLHVTVARAYKEEQITQLKEYEGKYSAANTFPFRFDAFDYVYDDVMNTSKLMGNIVCPGLQPIYRSLTADHSRPLTMQFLHSAPPLSRAVKSFVVSVADTLIMKEEVPFEFQNVYLVSEADYQLNFKSHYTSFSENTVVREAL